VEQQEFPEQQEQRVELEVLVVIQLSDQRSLLMVEAVEQEAQYPQQ
jgi:hypothetical protein